MSDQVPWVMALDESAAVLGLVGGKGASLARLARAGFRVPPGFDVTTGAYLDFVGRGGLRELVLAAMSTVDISDAATFKAASARIGKLFGGQPLPAASAAAIAAAYAGLGDNVAVAVRSSATAEDLPDLSFAGQQDTYLNIRGEAAVLDAVRRCWASLWTTRAIGYRARHGIGPGEVSIAVVVQQLVPADASGVLFTTDPVAGSGGQVVINANWGLGESVVGGDVTPDVVVVDRACGNVVSYRVGSKDVMTVPDGAATRETRTPAHLRAAAVLSAGQVCELARVAMAIEALYGEPMDIEWALAGDEFFVLQARPITTRAAAAGPSGHGPSEQWNDSFDGDYLWSNGNLGEALPDVMTPVTWSAAQLFMSRVMMPPSVPGYRGFGQIGGRLYANLSMSMALEALVGIPPRRFIALVTPAFGKLPPVEEIPRAPLPRWKVVRLMLPATVAMVRRVSANKRRMPEYLASAPSRCENLRAEIQQTTDATALADQWHRKVEPLLAESVDMLMAAIGLGTTLPLGPAKLATLVGEADAALLLSGQQAGDAPLASLGPAVGLAQLARGEIDRDTFARQHGHRGPHEAELSVPRPAEDPGWIDKQLAAIADTAHDAGARLASQETARATAWERLRQHEPKKAASARKMVARWTSVARAREAAKSELARSMWVVRTWVVRAGELTGHGDDVFFLSFPEILDVLRSDPAPLAAVAARRAAYETYRSLPPYPALIRGRFDPVRWAADPNRRSDHYDERAQATTPEDTITGFPGAAGVVEGTARVISTPEDSGRLGDGEVLVTTVTNIGWTPIFPRAAAVVTDVGAPLSHAAIVARELGIPAVVGCGNATMRLRSGDLVRVDGGKGTVEVLHPADIAVRIPKSRADQR